MADPTKTSTDSTTAAKAADAAATTKAPNAAATSGAAAGAGGPTGLDAAAGGGPTAATKASLAETRKADARASAKAGQAGARAASVEDDEDENQAPDNRSKPTSEGSFGHTQVGKTAMSPAPAEEREPDQIPKADINSDDDLEDEVHPDDRRAAVTMHQPEVKSPISHPPYDVQKVFGTANQSVMQDESGRWKIQFPQSVDTSAFDKKDANVNPSTTFATRELAYKAAVKLLKTSPTMNRKQPANTSAR